MMVLRMMFLQALRMKSIQVLKKRSIQVVKRKSTEGLEMLSKLVWGWLASMMVLMMMPGLVSLEGKKWSDLTCSMIVTCSALNIVRMVTIVL